MKTRLCTIFLILSVLVGSFFTVALAANSPNIRIDGKKVYVKGYIKNGKTQVALRELAEAMGYQVVWNEKENDININSNYQNILDIKDIKIPVNGIDIHAIDYGGSGKDVILVHGLTANARFWDAIAERLIKNYHVIAIDVRGRGDSDKPETGYYDYWQYVDDVKSVLDYYKIDKVIYMGHSMGALTGVLFANQYPERLERLVLVDAGTSIDPRLKEALAPAYAKVGTIYESYDSYINQNKKSPSFKEWNNYTDRYFWYDVYHNSDGTVIPKVAKQAIWPKIKSRGVNWDEINVKIKVPTLLLHAPLGLPLADGTIVPVLIPDKAQELAKILPQGSRYVEIEGSNHYNIILTRYEQTLKEINDFLDSTQ